MPSSVFIFLIITLHLLSSSSSTSAQSLSSFSSSNSPWNPSQKNKLLLSPNSAFAAGFLPSPTSPSLFIFSVWYNNLSPQNPKQNQIQDQSIIWSANWDSPVIPSASLSITSNGDLKLTNGSLAGPNLWNPPIPVNSSSTRLILQDDGNLVFGSSWESFRHPTDTAVFNQTIKNGTDLRSRNGKYSFAGSNIVYNGSGYCSLDNGIMGVDTIGYLVQQNGATGTYICADLNQNRTRKITLGNDGNLRVWSFDPDKGTWVGVWEAFALSCQAPGLCGSGAICYSNGSTESGYECVCPPGFKWSSNGDSSCVRKTPMVDLGESKFLRLDYVNYLGGSNPTDLNIYNYGVCASKCLANSRCLGFGFKYDGTGYCVLQLDNLLNGFWSPATQIVFYLRVDKSESARSNFTGMSERLTMSCPVQVSLPDPPKESHEMARNIIIITSLFTIEIATGVLLFWAFLKRYIKYRDMAQTLGLGLLPTAGPRRFTYAEIKTATKDFSSDNVIGKGGFSDVYMGKLQDGRPVAVKCLRSFTGGDAEFWAEVTIIARMHHLNLVRLWGFCNEKGQRILIYEHVPNGSLAKYLFRHNPIGSEVPNHLDEAGPTTELVELTPILDWNIRYRIALGVARAIAYLHEECLEWVLHCDIKPENILLGDDFCPKVADFGLSKLRKKEQLVTMSRIRGTRGYLAPEWTKHDSITSKVDVYSFGMVLLEIVSGVRNTTPAQSAAPSEEWYFPQWVFEVAIQEQRMDEILDCHIKHSYDSKVHFGMVDRMVKTAMWCVQERPEMRPSMGKVAKMLDGTVEIMEPPKPTIFFINEDEE